MSDEQSAQDGYEPFPDLLAGDDTKSFVTDKVLEEDDDMPDEEEHVEGGEN